MRHTFNGREQLIKGFKVDSVTEDSTILEFHGCFFDGHEAFYPRRSTVNPVSRLTMQELREKTRHKTDTLHGKGHVMIEKWECKFRKDVEANEELKAFEKYECCSADGRMPSSSTAKRQTSDT